MHIVVICLIKASLFMKKLKLNLSAQRVGEILSREELKGIAGGVGSGTAYGKGTCGAYVPKSANNGSGALAGSGSTFKADEFQVTEVANIYRGVSKEFAADITRGVTGAKWCCDNCGSASWY